VKETAIFLTKRSNGIFYICYFNSSGRWQRLSTKTKSKIEAKKFLVDFESNQNSCYPHIILSQFFEKYLEYSKIHHVLETTKKQPLQ